MRIIIILNKDSFTFMCQIEIGLSSQDCCLTSARWPKAPKHDLPFEDSFVNHLSVKLISSIKIIIIIIITLGQPKFQTLCLNRCLKLMILRLTFGEQTTTFPVHLALLKSKRETFSFVVGHRQNSISVNKR